MRLVIPSKLSEASKNIQFIYALVAITAIYYYYFCSRVLCFDESLNYDKHSKTQILVAGSVECLTFVMKYDVMVSMLLHHNQLSQRLNHIFST